MAEQLAAAAAAVTTLFLAAAGGFLSAHIAFDVTVFPVCGNLAKVPKISLPMEMSLDLSCRVPILFKIIEWGMANR